MRSSRSKAGHARERGAVLVTTLFLLMILFMMGVCILGIRAYQFKQGKDMALSSMAYYVAEAGMEDAKAKLEKDQDFPPRSTIKQNLFTYRENLTDFDSKSVGTYEVTIDRNMKYKPYYIIRVSSIGTVCAKDFPDVILARRKITAELDVTRKLRTDGTTVNPNCYKFINWQDMGSF